MPAVASLQGRLRAFRRPWLWLGLWLAAVAAVAALSLVPPPPVPVPDHFDKLEHMTGYLLLSAGQVLLFARRGTQRAVAAGLVAMGIGLEFAQALLTQTRTGDVFDVLANSAGVLLGLALSGTAAAGWLQRLDARWR